MAEIEDAYGRLNRARDRYKYEAYKEPSLGPAELKALRKVFEEDGFIEGMGKLRGIAEHVETGNVTLRDIHSSPYEITAASSAAVVFKHPQVNVYDTAGVLRRLDHLQYLTEADNRIKRAFKRAKES
jgi:hypothetical protein